MPRYLVELHEIVVWEVEVEVPKRRQASIKAKELHEEGLSTEKDNYAAHCMRITEVQD